MKGILSKDIDNWENSEPAQAISFYGFWAKIHIQGGSIPLKVHKICIYVLPLHGFHA